MKYRSRGVLVQPFYVHSEAVRDPCLWPIVSFVCAGWDDFCWFTGAQEVHLRWCGLQLDKLPSIDVIKLVVQATIKQLVGDMDSKLVILQCCTVATLPTGLGAVNASLADLREELPRIVAQHLRNTGVETTNLSDHMHSFVQLASAVSNPSLSAANVAEALEDFRITDANLSETEQETTAKVAVQVLKSSSDTRMQTAAANLSQSETSVSQEAYTLQVQAWRHLEGIISDTVNDRHGKIATVMSKNNLLQALRGCEARLLIVRLLLELNNIPLL